MTGVLTLGRPKAGVVSTFDAREYSLIDFLPIEYQWTALVQVGLTLRIVFSDGSVIELLNFYSFSLAGDSSGDDHTGTLADASDELLVLTSATGLMSVKEFARTNWTTKSSGYVAVPAFEGHDGEQASGGLTGQNAPDNVPLSIPPPPLASGGVEFPLPPVPPPFFLPPQVTPPLFLPPQVTHPPNNAAVITGDTAGSVVEAGGVTNAIPGVPVVSGDLDAADVDGPADSWNAVGAPTPSTNGYGTFMMTASGVWTYTLNNSNAAVDALAVGATLNDSFTVTAVDGTSQRVTITITGANDAPLVTGAVDSGVVMEGPLPVMTATGTIDFGDVDLADAHVTSVTPGGSGYLGTFVADVTNDSTGDGSGQVSWVFLANNQLRQSLQANQQLVQTYTVEIDDGHGGTVSHLVTITIDGTNDAAKITGDTAGSVVEAGGVANKVPGIPVANGDLFAADVDDPDDVWEEVGSPTASANGYGTFTIDAAGVWIYTLDNSNAAVQALNAGQTLTDTFTATTVDGTSQVVSITINGANDAAVTTGTATGAVTEAGGIANGTPGTPTAAGNLNSTDVDNPPDDWTAVGTSTPGTSGYGTYTLTATGVWTYTLDNSNATVQALNVGGTLTDTFTATTVDGTSQVVSITINGANDAAVITGATSGSVTEAGGVANGTPGTPVAVGNLDATDVDNPPDGWTPVATPTASANGYGTFTIDAAGVWIYTLNNSHATVQALNAGQTLADSFTVTTVDGTAKLVSITINGANDAAVITGTATGTVVEAGGVNNGTSGTPTSTGDLNSADVDNAADAWTAVGTTVSTSGYGSNTLTAAGVWVYTLDNSNATVQALNAGQTLTDSFTVTTVDGTQQLVTITITGANDAAVVTGTATGTVVEAGGVANGTLGTPTATGDLNSTDVDNAADAWTAVGTATASANGYGSYTLTATGVWAYTLDNNNPTVQALNAGGTLTDTFTATTVDGTSRVVTITINGANDAAVITGTATGAVTEAGGVNNGTPGTPSATGDLNSTDVDNAADAWTAVGTTVSTSGYGSYTLTAAGVWVYTLDNSNATVQALNAGQPLTDSFTVTTVDGTQQLVTITITGANDAAVITGTATGTVVEAGGVANGTLGTPTATGDLNSTDVDNPPDDWTAVAASTPGDNGYGSYRLTAAGVWAYTLNNSNAAVQALNAGQTLTDSFTVTTVDGTAQLVTITINGANDAAVITGPVTGAVTEAGGTANGTPGTPTATGDLNSTDVDNAADAWTAVGTATAGANGYGSYTLTAAGVWAYTLDNSNATVQALNAGQPLTDSFTVSTVDGIAQLVTVTINGANDEAVISGKTTGSVIEAGAVGSGQPGIPVAFGNLDATDVDNPPDDWRAVETASAKYGTYTLTAAGVWIYKLDNSNPDVQVLNATDILTDTFTAVTVDGTPQVVTITIHGTNDAAVISGDFTGTVLEAGGVANGTPGIPTATGDLDATDVDNPPDWTAVGTPTASTSGYGTYTLTAAGVWVYTLDDSNAAVQALNVGGTLTDTFTAMTVGNTAQVVTITIDGANDAAVITGTTTGAVTEAGGVANGTPGTPTATGNLNSTDVDNPNDAWDVVATSLRGGSGYGSYTLTATGVWAYTLDNNNATVQALNAGGTLTDTFTATTIDGTSQVVTITINGANDAAVITGTAAGAVTEAGGVANGTPGIPTATGDLNSTDVDNAVDAWTAVGTPTASTSGYGTYTLTAAGVWVYTLDDSNAAVQALNVGGTLTDTFTAMTVGNTAQVVTITIDGANDAAVITGTTTGAVTEAGGVANGTPGTPTATGNLNSTDVDNPNDAWDVVATSLRGGSGYGSYTLTATGVWAYTLDNNNATVQALNAGGTLTDTFTATTIDGTSQVVTITINGANDAAVITGTATGAVTEAGGVANGTPGIPTATGDLDATDVDNPPDWTAVGTPTASTSGYGTYTLTAAGVWVYTLDDSNATVQALNVGQTLTDTFTATTVDGTAQLVTVTINGTNDAAVITGATSGSVTEAGGVAKGTPGTPIVAGNLNSTDVDNPDDAWDAVGTSLRGASGFGTYMLTAAGRWAYTLDNSNATVQALNAGQTLTDSFTVTTVDGTAQLVTITIHGTDDAAVIGGDFTGTVLEAGGVANGTPGTPSATGDLNSTDVDNAADAWTAVGTTVSTSGYGSYTLTAAGVWVYTLDNSNATVQALNAGQPLTDSFTVTTVDGTQQLVTITITGANDAAVITGTATGTVVEAGGVANGTLGTPTATGDLNSTDVDNPPDDWTAVAASTPGDNGYGSYRLTAAGVWVYTLDNNNAAVQALNAGGTLTDTFTATTIDGTQQLVTITINGANDTAVITGTATGAVTEAGGVNNGSLGTPTATGDLNSTDVDNAADAWTAVGTTASANGFGSYTLTAAGVWIYTLDNSNAAVQALNAADILIDSFTVNTIDGTQQLVTITITGANDAAVITGTASGSVTEAGGVANGTPGIPIATGDLTSTDVDNPNDAWTAVDTATASANGYGTYTLTAAGVWAYTLDNNNATVQALSTGDTLPDSFTVTTIDGTQQLVTITIHGTDDAAVISGDFTGTVLEAGGVANGTPGIPTATGGLDAADDDNPPDWTPVGTPTLGDNGYGSYTLTAAGVWVYTLDNSNATVQALNVGQTLTDTFTAMTVGNTAQVVAITIDGANDAAVISSDFTGTVLEAGGVANGTPGTSFVVGDLDAADVDNTSDSWTAIETPTLSANGYGTFTIDAAGLWTYILDDDNAAVQALNVGDTLTDTFTAFTVDGTSQVITITINGANDAAVIIGDTRGNVVEAGGVNNGSLGTPTATGDLTAIDVDNPPDWAPVGTPTLGDNSYGSYTLTADGIWTYTLDDSNATVQGLNAGDTLTDRFTVTTIDGTTRLVTVTINGANDAAVIIGDTTGSVIEASGSTPGIPTAAGHLNSTDVDNPDDAWEPVGTSLRGASGFGSYTLTTAGVWTYTLDNSNATVQALNAGGTLSDSFTATTVDGTEQLITITIHGSNDAAVISGVANGSVTEAGGVANGTPGIPIATGDLNSTDVDNPSDAWTAVVTAAASTKGYGSYTLTAAGLWTYTLDNSNADVQALNVGQILSDTFTVFAIDGTSQVATIVINGSNDAAVVSGATTGSVVEAGGVANGTPGTPTVAGNLNSNDVDDPNDVWTVISSPAASTSGFGSYTLTASGLWIYTLDNSNADVQALNAGQTLTDTFTATTIDGTQQLVTITINGANDTAVITGTATGAVTEAGGVNNGTPGTPPATGDLNSTDIDNPNDAWTAVDTATVSANGFGSYTLTAAGVWIYTLDNSNAAVQALNAADILIDSFTVTTVGGAQQLVTITITGANDAAVITGDTTATVIEAGGVANGTPEIPIVTGDLTSTEVDNPPDDWTAVAASTPGANGYGTYTLTAGGAWTYTLDNNNATVQALNAGGTLTDTFTATTIDGTQQLVTVTINGANDTAVITGTATGAVTEAGGVNNGSLGTPTATGDLNSTDVDNAADAWTAVGTTASANGFGSYTLTAAGVWIYTLDNSNAAVQALNAADILIDSFTVTTIDGTQQLVTITITGANDAAVITGETTGSVTEAGGVGSGTPGIPIATGDLTSTEVDNPPDDWTAVNTATGSANGYGTYTLTAGGAWTYTLDNNNATVQALSTGDTLPDSFTVTTIDGTQQLVTITIHGTDDAAVISGDFTGTVLEAGGVANSTPGIPTATGDLDAADDDNPPDWTPVGTPTLGDNGYGSYTLTAAGVWVYTLDNSNATVQALNVGQTLTDTFTVTTVDGTAQLITITIDGANDAAVITGDTTATVHEAGGVANGTPGIPIAIGNLDSTDVDNPNDTWEPDGTVVLRGDSGFSTYTVSAAGVWTYTLDNTNPAVQALNVGQTLTDTLTAIAIDGTQQVVTITIEGANDAAVISGTTSGSVTEAGGVNNGTPGTPTATGDLNSTDVDNAADAWTVVSAPTASTDGFGSYTLTASGVWLYTLNNNNATVQALNVGQTLTDTFTVTTVDGTAQLVTITINGANDAALITGDTTATVHEAGGVANGTPGIPIAIGNLDSTDVDNPNDTWEPDGTVVLRGDSGFSTYTVSAAGVWTYTLDNTNPAVQALNVGQTLTDTLTAIAIDGTQQVLTITIEGANDAAVISGTTSGSVTEAGGVNNGTPGTPTATGDLNSTDVDNPNDAWMAAGAATASGYGSYTLSTAGVWIYTLDNSNATVQALNVGQTLTDTFTAITVDGTQQLVTITINGRNDAAVISGDTSGSVTEAGGVNNGTQGTPTATGNLNSTDVDNSNNLWEPVTSLRSEFGTYTLTAAGAWTYTLDDDNPAVQARNVGQTLTDTFAAFTVDGTAQLVTITIDGRNDAAVITGPVTGTVVEAGEVNNSNPGTPTATGDLSSSDLDNPNDVWTAVVTATTSTSGFGSYTLTAAGVWTYTLDNSNAAVQGLNTGQTLTDTFTVRTVDGTAQVMTITIDGSNDNPAAVADNNAGDPVTESGVNPGNTPFAGDPSAAGNVLTNDIDVDSGDTKTVVAVNGEVLNVGQPLVGTYGTLTLQADGSWAYALNNADPDTNALAQGQTATDAFTYTMADANGATSSSSLTITITGTNDAPDIAILSGDSATATLTETGVGLTTSGTMTVGDPDLTDTVTVSVTAVALNGTTGGLTAADVLGMLSVNPGSIAADPGDTHNLGWTFNSGAQAFNFLNSADTLTLAYTVQATDGSASDVQTVTINIAGSGAHEDTILVSDSTTVVVPWSALLANDSDPNATITGVTDLNGVIGGTIPVTLDANAKTITFNTPNISDLIGNTFTYTVSNGSTATVNVGVMQVGDGLNVDLSRETYDFSYMFPGNSNVINELNNGNDEFIGGPGTDYFFGGKGNDIYQFEFTGGGNDQINESILGGKGNDIIQITTPINASYTDLNFQRVDADVVGSVDDLLITYNGQSITVINEFSSTKADHVETMSFNGGTFAGYSLGTGPYTIDGTTGSDDIVAGTSGNDSLNGGSGGNDLIFAGAGNDTLDGGSGNDLLVGGTANDSLFGGGGNDTYLFGLNDGIDTINENGGANAGGGNDQITIMANGAALSSLNFSDTTAGAGGNLVIDYNDAQITVINEFSGNNDSTVESLTFLGGASYLGYDLGSATYSLNGGVNNSIQVGDSGDNTLSGGLGADLIFGNAGNDTITGGGGKDLLVGGAGNDRITGGTGDDVIVGGTGNDILTGGGGNDRFVFAEAGPANVDTITDHNTKDAIDLSPLLDSHFHPTDNPADFVRLVQNGSDVVVQADADGAANGQNWDNVVVLQGYGTTGQDLVHIHFGNATHDLLV